ncbi:MAG: ABC transporter ATP-binding protein [Oscillospiraceae bacterium]
MDKTYPLLSCDNIIKHYPVRKGLFSKVVGQKHIVEDVSLEVREGKTTALVGESGCGKSVLLRIISDIEKPTFGKVCFKGCPLDELYPEERAEMKKQVQMIFQDTLSSLHPRMTIQQSIEEPLKLSGVKSAEERLEIIKKTFNLIGLDTDFLTRYPHQLSGGQRQRAVIARALVVNPKLLLADEPISALDVSLQAQIINLLMDLQSELDLAILLVAHDLAVVRQIADEILIMYLGHIVERAKSRDIYKDARHPYTKVLLKAAPSIKKGINDEGFSLDLKVGDAPTPDNPPEGCPFCTKCIYADKRCMEEMPENVEVSPGHFVMCHKFNEVAD